MQVYRVKRIIIGLLAPAGACIIGVKSRSTLPADPASQTGSHQARRGAVAARQAHNLEVSGSNPLAATPKRQRPLPPRGSLCFPPATRSRRRAGPVRLLRVGRAGAGLRPAGTAVAGAAAGAAGREEVGLGPRRALRQDEGLAVPGEPGAREQLFGRYQAYLLVRAQVGRRPRGVHRPDARRRRTLLRRAAGRADRRHAHPQPGRHAPRGRRTPGRSAGPAAGGPPNGAVLRVFEELPAEEVAQRMGRTAGAVRLPQMRALDEGARRRKQWAAGRGRPTPGRPVSHRGR